MSRFSHRVGSANSILAALALVGGMLAVLTTGAGARVNTCQARNLTRGTARSADLQAEIDAANAGDTIQVKRVCVGNFVIKKDLVLVGEPTRSAGRATLDGNGSGRVLLIVGSYVGGPASVEVTLTNLRITNGSTPGGYGAGIYNDDAELTLSRSLLSGNDGAGGAGIQNSMEAIISLRDSVVSGNTAYTGGGGIANHGTLTLNGSSRVRGNEAGRSGGGIFNGGEAELSINDSSSVSGNTADADEDGIGTGGGIFDCGTTFGALEGVNVFDNHLADGTANNIEEC